MAASNFRFFEFGEFRMDAHRRTLQKNGSAVHLTPRAFDLLCVLVEHPGRILEHDELLDKVWDGTFVEQSNLKKTVSALRQALGESPEASEFITTVPRRGYRFTAPVRPLTEETILIRETRAEITVEEETEDQIVVAPSPKVLSKAKNTKTRNIAFVGGTIIALAIAAFAVWKFGQTPPPRFSVQDVKIERQMSESNVIAGVLSPDGNYFCYVVMAGMQKSLWVRQTASGSARQVVPPTYGSFWSPTFSPDANFVYYALNDQNEPSKSGVYRVPAFGGDPQLILEKVHLNLKVSPDGKRLAFIRTVSNDNKDTHELLTMNTDGSDEKLVLALPYLLLFRGVAWSPDGSSILYGVRKLQTLSDKPTHYVAEIPAFGGTENILLPEQDKIIVLNEWMPDKSSFLLSVREQNSEIYQIWQYSPASGEFLRVTNDNFSYGGITVTRDGKTLGASRSFSFTSVWEKETAQDNFRQIATGTNAFDTLQWTADERLVFSGTENGGDVVGIMNADGSQKRFLTGGTDGFRPYPNVSGNGKQIVFISDRTGNRQVWRIDLDGKNLTQLTNITTGIGEAKLLSDGQTIIYDAYLKSAHWLLVKQTADGKAVQLTDTDTLEWDISPDEKYLAIYTSDEKTQKKRLIVREIESGKTIKDFDTANVLYLRWAHDGKALTFVKTSEDFKEIVLLPLDGTPERVLTTVRGESIANFDWSPDGKRLALVRYKPQYEAVLIQTDEMR